MKSLTGWVLKLMCALGVVMGTATGASPAGAVTPIPKSIGPVPVTAQSYPFAHTWNIDLKGAGYVEEEFFVSGRANVYEVQNDAAVVRASNAPYTTRLLVRRPADARRFSGRVLVEIVNMSRGWDLDTQWHMQHEYLMRNGDAYVGVTSKPNTVRALKIFDPQRYAPLSWAYPLALSDPRNCEKVPHDSARETENGLLWDILSQVGALLKSNTPQKPLAGFRVQRIYLAGYSQSGAMLITYVNFIHPAAKLAGGKPVYDGYLIGGSPFPFPINQCAAQGSLTGDQKGVIRPRDVPVIMVLSETDVLILRATGVRRADSDDPGDRYRLYEVAGGSHGSTYPAQFEPPTADVVKAGGGITSSYPPGLKPPSGDSAKAGNRWFYRCEAGGVAGDFPLYMIFNIALDNLDRWVCNGTAPPRADRFSILKAGTPDAAVERDRYGNALGGLRTPFLDVPIATYFPTSGQGECRLSGHRVAFEAKTLQGLYANRLDYLTKFNQDVDRLVKERWLTYADGQTVKSTAENADWPADR